MATIAKNLVSRVDKGSISAENKAETLANITTFTDLKEGVKNVRIGG